VESTVEKKPLKGCIICVLVDKRVGIAGVFRCWIAPESCLMEATNAKTHGD